MYGMWFLENGVVVFVKQTIMAMVIGSIIIVFLLFPQAVSDSAKEGLLMWFQIVLPSLLPFSIVSSVIMGLGLTERITGVVTPVLQRVFGITRSGCYAVVVGMLSGYPLGAATTAELYRGQRICKEEAQYILTFCNNASPMFLTEFIGVSCMGLHKPLIVLILVYIAGWIGSVIDRGGRHIMRSLGLENSWSAEFAGRKQEKPYAGNVINVLDESILHSFVILTKVGGYIILFSILAGIVQQMCPFAPEYKAGIVSALEITTGAVLHPAGIEVADAADAALALEPIAGEFSTILFASGLVAASFLAACVLPGVTSSAICEAFGWERGADRNWEEAPIYRGLITAIIVASALLVIMPGVDLFQIMMSAQVINGVLLPILLVFLVFIAQDKHIMGKYRNGRVWNVLTWGTIILITVLTAVMFGLQAMGY